MEPVAGGVGNSHADVNRLWQAWPDQTFHGSTWTSSATFVAITVSLSVSAFAAGCAHC